MDTKESRQDRWEIRYRDNELPWDTGRADTYLVRTVSRWPACRGSVLDVGCGTGSNSIWLAEQGFDVTGLDISANAVAIAEQRAAEAGVSCRFLRDDFLTCPLQPHSVLFVFDRGCFHSAAGEEARTLFARQVAVCLQEKGLWLSLIGNADDTWQDKGPPRLTAGEIVTVVEPFFEIIGMESCLIESRRAPSPRFWQCLMRRRTMIDEARASSA